MSVRKSLLSSYCDTLSARFFICLEQHQVAFLFVIGLMLLTAGILDFSYSQSTGPTGSHSQAQFDDELIRNAVGNLFRLIEGAFGALIMVVAGLGAIIAAAIGAYRAAISLVVVAVGSFILRALVSLFFGTDFDIYETS